MDGFCGWNYMGKHAVTHFGKLLEELRYVSWSNVKLEDRPGRHQDFVAHMKFIGHPLFNDLR